MSVSLDSGSRPAVEYNPDFNPVTFARENPDINGDMIRRCIEIAESAKANGNHPFGALLYHDGKIVLEMENKVVTTKDCTKHAELGLVSEGCQKLAKEVLRNSILYTSTEPCAMCAASIFWAKIPVVVYGSPTEVLREYSSGSFVVPSRELYSHATREVTVIGPVIPDEAEQVHIGFWK